MGDRALSLDGMFPRERRISVALRAMMADFKGTVRRGELKDRPGEEAMAVGYGRTLGEAIDVMGNVLEVDLTDRVQEAVKEDALFGHLVGRAQRQLLLALLQRLGEVKISVEELESLGGGLSVDMSDDGALIFCRRPSA